ncbi:hypothetical protein Tco_0749713 [Tanacetum coccineum]|uniref:Uncharacterized protein n=1 Tax=Tanacetum coccineum TaxID=301880 RepID=A0ABQ4Z2B4_9ASTR
MRVHLSDSEEEETEAQGRKFHDLDPLVSLVQELVTPSKTVNASGEEQVEYISPTTLEAAAILTKVHRSSQLTRKSETMRRIEFKRNLVGNCLDVNTGIDLVTTDSIRVSVPSLDREDWDTIRAKLEANSELKDSVLGKDLTIEDYAKRMVELLNFEEVKAEFEKLVKQLDTYVPMNFEATKESLKRFGEELQTKTAKKLKFDDEGTQPTEEKIEEDKDDKPTKKTGKRRKHIARKGFHIDYDMDD